MREGGCTALVPEIRGQYDVLLQWLMYRLRW